MIKREYYRADGPRGSREKAPIDTEIEEFLRAELALLTPHWSILGEELPFREGADPSHRWVLDPQDGTSAFLRGFRGSSVSIALTRDHQPVLGVVHAPLYPNDEGDIIYGAQGVGLFRNGREIHPRVPTEPLDSSDVVAVSQDADRRIDYNLGTLKPARYLPMPSVAYRLALAAAGEVRAGTSLAPLRALDVAAGHALLLLTGRQLHHLSTPDRPDVDYRNDQRLHGVIGGDPVVIQSLTPWPWSSYFGPGQNPPLARPSHRNKASGMSLSRGQGCLLGQLTGEPTTPPGRADADSELALAVARRILSDGGLETSGQKDTESEWLRSKPETEPLGPLFRSCPLGLAFSPEKLSNLFPHEPSDLNEECLRAFTLAISRAIEGAGAKEVVYATLETASPSLRALLIDKQRTTDLPLRAFQTAFTHLEAGTPLMEAIESSRIEGPGASVVGALLGAFQGYESIPGSWRRSVLTCRLRSRPIAYWPVDALLLAEHLLSLRKIL